MGIGPSNLLASYFTQTWYAGLLIDDPHDLTAFGDAVEHLLREPTEAQRLAHNARQRAAAEFLGDRHLEQWYEILQGLR